MHMQNAWIYGFSDGKLTRGRVSLDTAVLRDTVEGITPPGLSGSRLARISVRTSGSSGGGVRSGR